jgi:hypothetical protein
MPETGGIARAQLVAAKISDPGFRVNLRKFYRHIKGLFPIGNVRVRIRRPFEKFPFLGDRSRRLDLICTAWREGSLCVPDPDGIAPRPGF